MIPTGFVYEPADKEAKKQLDEKRFQNAMKAVAKAQDTLKANIPFIPENIYIAYNEILKLSYIQLMAYERRFDVNDPRPQSEKETFILKDYEKTEELNNKWNVLNNMIRDYINSIEILP